MGAISDAKASIEAACDSVTDLRVGKLGEDVDPPAVIVIPPVLDATTFCGVFDSAAFDIYIVVARDERTEDHLYELVPAVLAAINNNTDAVVRQAVPGSFNVAGRDLPAYKLTAEHPLEA